MSVDLGHGTGGCVTIANDNGAAVWPLAPELKALADSLIEEELRTAFESAQRVGGIAYTEFGKALVAKATSKALERFAFCIAML